MEDGRCCSGLSNLIKCEGRGGACSGSSDPKMRGGGGCSGLSDLKKRWERGRGYSGLSDLKKRRERGGLFRFK